MTIAPDTSKAGYSADELEDLDRRLLLHPHQSAAHAERCVIVRGSGCTVWDAHGNELLDAMGGGNWVAQVGHGRPELAQAAARQVSELEYFTGFDIYTNEQAIRLAQRLVELAPAGLERVFFTSGGSESVETAMKLARLYHYHRKEPDRTWIIARQFAYHGSTYGSGAATGFPGFADGIGLALPHVTRVTLPHPYRAEELYGGQDTTDYLINELSYTIDQLGPGNIAAMIGEPVMGGAGVLVPPADYWPRVRELLSRHGILLIADEVVTGFGRTGAWFDSAERGMQADIVVTAKGLTSGYAPLGAVLMTGETADLVSDVHFFHGHTYFGHPLPCAVALANLDLMQKEGLIERARTIGTWFERSLAPLADLPHVGDIRIAGATVGVELVADRRTREPLMGDAVTTEMRRRHRVVVREYGNNLVFAPPLVITEEQVEQASTALHEVLSRLGADGQLTPA